MRAALKLSRLSKSLQIESSILSLCCKTKINTPLMYEVLDKDTIKFENLPHSSATKRSFVTKKIAAEGHSVHSLQVESGQSVAHNEEKVKEYFFMFLMSLCQHGHICAKTRKVNVFVKPNEQCRACSNIVMARKRTFKGTRKEQLTRSLVHLSSY